MLLPVGRSWARSLYKSCLCVRAKFEYQICIRETLINRTITEDDNHE